jgi:DNA-binding CsgD family transcriptional regulator
VEALTQRHLQCLLDFLQKTYSLCDLAQFRSHVVTALPDLIPSDLTGYNEVNAHSKQIHYVGNPANALYFPDAVSIFERHMHEHPLIAYHTIARDPRVLKISDFLGHSRFRHLGLYQDFFRLLGVEYQMACELGARNPLLIGIAVNRSRKDFTEQERMLLTLARPHLMQAYRNAATYTRLTEQLAAGQRQLLELDGVIVLNCDGQVSTVPSTVRRLLTRYFGCKSSTHGLPDTVAYWVRQQSDLVLRFEISCPLIVRRTCGQLTIRFMPGRDRVLLLVEEEPLGGARAARPSGALTRRETEVLRWVAQGKSNAAIGTILFMRTRTVEKHLERIFEKLGVESRTAAARFWEAL